MTPAEAKAFIADRLTPKKRAALQTADFVTAWQALTPAAKDAIVASAVAGKSEQAGQQIEHMLLAYARSLAEIDADTMVADGSLTLAEFSEIFD